MSTKKPLTLSIVIPVYNEEHHLKSALEAIAAQTIKPYEVLVVDNNSTDKSMAIASRYPFVRRLQEKRQGQVFAQAAGFNAAHGDILARIDADTILPPAWAAQILEKFQAEPRLAAVTGGAEPYDVPLKRIGSKIFEVYHERIAAFFAGQPLLWGANCAFRGALWPKVKNRIAMRADIWEDYDLSFQLLKYGRIEYLPRLAVGCSFRAAHKTLPEQARYQVRAMRTIALHTRWWQAALFALAWCTLLLVFPITFADRYIWKWRNHRMARLKARR